MKSSNTHVGTAALGCPVERSSTRFSIRPWLSCVLLLCTLSPSPLAAKTPPIKSPSLLEQTAIANEKSLIEAKKKDDAAFFKQTLTPDFSLVGVDGQLVDGPDAADNLGDSNLLELTPYDIKVVSLGDDAAIVTYDAIVREAPAEDQDFPPRYQHFSSVWIKQSGQWKLKFHQATPTHWGDW
ncbi:MAG: nuclear transport factor 2 family protein [Candidatus Sulfotelmatobacter sp.]